VTKDKKKKKSKKLFGFLVIVLILMGLGGYYAYYVLVGPSYESTEKARFLENPVKGLTNEEAIVQFNNGFVLYLLYSIRANELHRPPLSSNTPKIEVVAGDKVFNAEIFKGQIEVSQGEISKEDVVIRTSKEEIVKMLRDSNYVLESFRNGDSEIELVAGELSLAAKGYLKLYKEVTGDSQIF
jgi:hypothetical protein